MGHFHVVTNLYPPDVLGGYELLALDVVRRLRRRGHQVTVVTTGKAHAGDEGVARILRLYRPFGSDAKRDRLRQLAVAAYNRLAISKQLAERGKPDAVLVMSMRRLGLEPLRVYQEHGVRTVFTVNDDWPAAYVVKRGAGLKSRTLGLFDASPLARHTWRGISAEHVVYVSRMIRKLVCDAGAPLPTGTVCPQGVNLDVFQRRPFRPIVGKVRLLFVGRVHPAKAPDVAIDTLRELRRRGVDAELTIAGAAISNRYLEQLMAQVADAGLERHVDFLGHVPRRQLPGVYRDSDIFLFPLRWQEEAQGLTYMEAIGCGVPVVAFPTGGALELLRAKQGAEDVVLVTPRCDGSAFADACQRLLASAEAQRLLVERAYDWLSSHASLSRYVAVLEGQLLDTEALPETQRFEASPVILFEEPELPANEAPSTSVALEPVLALLDAASAEPVRVDDAALPRR